MGDGLSQLINKKFMKPKGLNIGTKNNPQNWIAWEIESR